MRRRPPRLVVHGAALFLFWVTLPIAAEPDTTELGPAPRGADGRFENAVGALAHGGVSVRLPFVLRRIAGSFRTKSAGAPERVANDGAFLRENAKHSTPTVTWIGHATMLVQMDHVTFLTDPIWSNTPSPVSFAGPRRYVPPGIAIDNLPPIDFVLVSHNHYDHLDIPTLVSLAGRNPDTRFLVPLGNAKLLRDRGLTHVEELDWGESREVAGVRIYCLPAQHWSKRGLRDSRKALWSSWAVAGLERRFFFAGDTGYFDGFTRIREVFGSFDLVALPIGAYAPVAMMQASHMNPEEAVQAAIDLNADRVIAMHYGTFDLSDEPLPEPPRRFREAANSKGLNETQAWTVGIGEVREF